MWKRFIELVAPDIIKSIRSESYNKGYNDSANDRNKQRNSDKLFEMKELVGKKVITFSNEWEDMVVATVIGIDLITQAKQPILRIKDCFTGFEYLTFGQVYEFNEDLLNGLLMLTPYERWNIKVPHAQVSWDKPHLKTQISSPISFRDKLREVNFL